MVPIVVLIGRTNVGKSTLFNYLTRTHDALVANMPGITRDRKYGFAKLLGHEFVCVDTGGIGNLEKGVNTHIAKQSLLAMQEADIVLFIVDACSGLNDSDFIIAKQLRSTSKLTLLVVNKTNGIHVNQLTINFWSLGIKDIYCIDALYGHGMNNFLKTALFPLINQTNLLVQSDIMQQNHKLSKIIQIDQKQRYHNVNWGNNVPIKFAIVGRQNVGKSTLANYILGEDRMIVYNVPGTTRDSVYVPMQYNNYQYILIDTAGIRKNKKIVEVVEKFSIMQTLKAIKDANVVMLVIDANEGILDQDLSLMNFILTHGRSLVIIVNKWDLLNQNMKKQIKQIINYRINFFINFARIHFVSALYGTGVNGIFKSIHEAYNSSIKHVSTAVLMRIMTVAIKDHQPPIIHGRRVNIKYACASSNNPLTITLYGNQVKYLSNSYKRYLINYFRKALNIVCTSIFIKFKEYGN